jgi:acetyl-CoA/propionyl-CoA carboxylase biotin carboxyl carrier protein
MIRRMLIANRGEIARRIMRACRDLGIRSIAVYSDADADAPHVSDADEAIRIGPPAATESYLNIPAILDAAKKTRADAIHPGYGFLSENAAFATQCADAGLTFIGPPGSVIARMGSKTAARATVRAAGVPVVPGETPASQSEADIEAAIRRVGYPVLLKASSGGGGKGMRVVRSDAEAAEAIATARREAERAFAAGSLYAERLVERPRHIEIQIFADTHGNVVHLFERDCSLQRRHQKVIEEAPGPTVTPRLRERITQAAIAAAKSVGYVNAGTCEFLLDGEGDEAPFYFLEMNTRLQVEHPVTEAITGLDLVHLQIAVANGEPLPFRQDDVKASGHAIEGRVYAEDSRSLLPQSGRLLRYREPEATTSGVHPESSLRVHTRSGLLRIDSGVREGQTIGVHYDPLLAKVITHHADRATAIDAMAEALRKFEILGLRHNIPLLLRLLAMPEMREARTYTTLIEERLGDITRPASDEVTAMAIAVAAAASLRGPTIAPGPDALDRPDFDPWTAIGPVRW